MLYFSMLIVILSTQNEISNKTPIPSSLTSVYRCFALWAPFGLTPSQLYDSDTMNNVFVTLSEYQSFHRFSSQRGVSDFVTSTSLPFV